MLAGAAVALALVAAVAGSGRAAVKGDKREAATKLIGCIELGGEYSTSGAT